MTQPGQVQFTRDGQTLVLGEAEAFTLIALRGEQRRRVEVTGIQAIATFADQLWVATRTGALLRFALDGRQLDESSIPTDPSATLVATTVGGAVALWTAATPMLLIDDLGSLTVTPVDHDVALPIAGRRIVRRSANQLTLPGGIAVSVPHGAKLGACAVLFEGTALGLVTEQARRRDLAVITLASGRIQKALVLPSGLLRIASRRGLAVVLEAPRRIAIFDLWFGRHLGHVIADTDVVELAVDPDGRLLALQLANGQLELAPIGEGMAAAERSTASGDVDEGAPAEITEEAAAASPDREEPERELAPVIAPPPRQVLDVRAFAPRAAGGGMRRTEALAALDRELRSVVLWTLQAIAEAWDSRRLGYGDEGKHPYEHEVAALVGMNEGFARDYVAAAAAALAAHELALAADPGHRGAAAPLSELSAEFDLSPAAIDVLLAIAAPSLHGEAARLYGILGNDPGRALVDERLVQQVLAPRVNRHDVAAELQPRAPLVRLGLVALRGARGRPFAGLEVDPVILARLRGEPPELGVGLTIREADRTLDDLELAPGVLDASIAAINRAAAPARIVVRGRAGVGRRALLAAFAARAQRGLGVIDATMLPRDADRFTLALGAALRRAQLAGLVPVVGGLDTTVFAERSGAELARDLLAAHPGPLAVIAPSQVAAPLPVGHVVIDLPALSETERGGVWERALAGTGWWLRDLAGLAARYRVGPGVIHRAVAALADHDPLTPCDDRVDAFLRQSRDVRLADHARRVERLASWSDLVLAPDIMDSLRELVGRVRHRRTVFEAWGMGRTMATSRGLTALFQGQPGTGKTLVAGVIARELGLDLYQVDLSKVMSKWIGETERNLATIFDAAEDGQVILLFDEADSLFAKRTEVRSSNDRYANLEVNYLLQRLDAFEGIAILTTNSGGSIDPAFKRRLSFRLSFPFPDEDTRAELWRAHLPRELPRAGELTFDVLARKYQLSGGYIRNACLRAAFLAAQEETALHQHHLERAVALEFAELGKLCTGGTLD